MTVGVSRRAHIVTDPYQLPCHVQGFGGLNEIVDHLDAEHLCGLWSFDRNGLCRAATLLRGGEIANPRKVELDDEIV
jgi:hypothetical protein